MKLKMCSGTEGRFSGAGHLSVAGRVPEGLRDQGGWQFRKYRLCPAYFPLVNKARGGNAGNRVS
jgi:hypothetical protein